MYNECIMGKVVKNVIRYVSIFVCLVLSIGLFSACSLGDKKEDNSYAVSGYVFDEFGEPVAGVLISSDISSATTDEEGKYTISGITNSIILSPSKKGYKFAEASRLLTSSTDDANFLAYEEYEISGVAHNNGVALAGANVVVDSLSGTFYTMTDENGQFIVSGVAGESTINCEVDSLQFYELKTTIDNPNVQIITSSSLTIELEFEEDEVDYSKIELFVNGEKLTLNSSTKVIEDINCGSVVELKSEYYHFGRTSKFIVSKLNQTEKFSCKKIYSLSGTVKSGNVPLEDASILLDGKIVAYTGENGNFVLSGLYGERTLSVEKLGFTFESKQVSKETAEVNFGGTKSVSVLIECDYDNGADFDFGAADAQKISNFEYLLSGVALGDEIELSSNLYHLNANKFEVVDDSVYTLSANAFYAVAVIVEDIENYTYLLDGNEVDSLSGLYGKHNISVKYQDYIFTNVDVDFENTEAVIEYLVPYSVKLKVHSGDIVLASAVASIGNEGFVADANGEIVIDNLVLSNDVIISANGYNEKTITLTEEKEIDIELSYDACGYVIVADAAVSMAEVKISETIKTTTDETGYFEFANLTGRCAIFANKEMYSFENEEVSNQTIVTITGTYEITGNVSIEGVSIENYVIHLRDIETGDEVTAFTDASGNYSFENLSKSYFLYATNAVGAVELKPVSYTLVGAGRYNFSSNGYSVSGYIKTGNVPIANVKVVAGSDSVYTDANGYYHFELLTQECSIYAEKDGYTFSGAIDVNDTKEDANFTATYELRGKIIVDLVPVAGVKVTIGGQVVYTDENGEYKVSGLEGEVNASFEKEGFEFSATQNSFSGSGEIELTSKVVSTAIVKTGDIQIYDFECYIGTIKQIVENGVAKFTAEKGTVVTFVKSGYEISSIVVDGPMLYTAQATYTISGKVISGTNAIARAYVFVGEEQVTTTNSSGEFVISGLVGLNTISFTKTGFTIGDINVNAATNGVVANATYKVYGTITVGSRTLEGVKVTCGTEEFTTLADGKFEFTGVSGIFGLTFVKDGYLFENVSADKFGEQKFTIDAAYSLSGEVKTGNIKIAGATIVATLESSGAEIETMSDENGAFTLSGIKGVADIIVSKDGYLTATILGFSDLTTDIVANLKYNVTVNFDVAGVAVYVNGNKQIVTNKTLSLTGIQGENTLRFELANTSFSLNNVKVRQPGTLNITSTKSYSISGYVKTDKGLAIPNMVVVSNAGDTAITDENGYYEFANVAGSITIQDENIAKETKNITANGVYNFTVSNNDFAYMLYANAYQNLDNAASVQIFGTGAVVGDAGITKTTQYVYSLFKRDNKGNILKQNLNYGEAVFGIDPKVSLVTYLQAGSNVIKYQQLEDGDVTGKTTAKHNVSNFSSISISDYKTKFGEGINDYSPYDITKAKITVYSNVILNSNGNYEFTLTISNTQAGYSTRIKQLSGVTFKSFSLIELKFEILKSGWIKQVVAHDKYKINQTVDVDIDSVVTYVYHTNKANLQIEDMSIASNDALNNSLAKSSQTELDSGSVSATNYACGDIVSQVIYGK